jgi:hypothetical protein
MSDVRAAVAGALAALVLLLVLVNIVLDLANAGVQADVNRRQSFINQNAAVMNIDNALVRALATAAATNKDTQIDDALKRAGVTYTLNPPPAQAATPPPAQGAPAPAAKP